MEKTKLRPEVQAFAKLMEERLALHDNAKGRLDADLHINPGIIINGITGNAIELRNAVSRNFSSRVTSEHAADLANYALMSHLRAERNDK